MANTNEFVYDSLNPEGRMAPMPNVPSWINMTYDAAPQGAADREPGDEVDEPIILMKPAQDRS